MEYTFFIIVVVAVIVVIYIKDKQRTETVWRMMAKELGLAYLGSPGAPSMTGSYKGHPVRIKVYSEGSGSSSQTFTGFNLDYKRTLPVDFQLGRQGFTQNFITMVGGQDIEVGDKAFDSAVVVKGRNVEAVKHFLSDEWVRRSCLSLIRKSTYQKVRLTNRKLEVSLSRKIMSLSEARTILNHLVDTAIQLEKDTSAEVGEPEKLLPPPLPAKKEYVAVPTEWHEQEPEEVEIHEPVEVFATEPEPVVPQVTAAAEAPQPAREPEVVAEETPLIREIAGELFAEKLGKYEAGKLFDILFKGETVRWHGIVKSISPGESDRFFGRDSGWIALFVIGRFPEMKNGTDSLKVKYRIGREKMQHLREQIDSRSLIEGELVKFDPFTSTLYIDSGDEAEAAQLPRASRYQSYAERLQKDRQSRPGEVRRFS
ncbi:MAG: hypothetical protein P1V20_17935 [Verrucomicrobiales bacterium]|nr:hypothetical protein [Verrucomicrobiales bacterium]